MAFSNARDCLSSSVSLVSVQAHLRVNATELPTEDVDDDGATYTYEGVLESTGVYFAVIPRGRGWTAFLAMAVSIAGLI
jgi:hypothetical protein